MAVNGIELKEGQKWRTHNGDVRTLKNNPDSFTYCFLAVREDGEWSSITADGKYMKSQYVPWLKELVYNPLWEENVPEQSINKFNPKPGDKIICNNGEEFICCTKETLEKILGLTLCPHAEVLGYSASTASWQDWNDKGVAEGDDDEYGYNIREVIPKQKEEDMQEVNKEEPKYTAEDIRKAFAALGWEATSYRSLIEALNKVANPEYLEYLRLKAIYE